MKLVKGRAITKEIYLHYYPASDIFDPYRGIYGADIFFCIQQRLRTMDNKFFTYIMETVLLTDIYCIY